MTADTPSSWIDATRLPVLLAEALGAGFCSGLISAVALSEGGLPLAVGTVVAITMVATRPWTYRRRRLDRRHAVLVDARRHRRMIDAMDDMRRVQPFTPAG